MNVSNRETKVINVFIVDDDNLLIDGIAKFFKESPSFNYVDRANQPNECLAKLESIQSKIDIILMDVRFKGSKKDGIQLARDIRDQYPGKHPRIVFMTISDRAIVDLEQGFHGLIPKNQGILELMEMLKAIFYEEAIFLPPKKASSSPFEQFTEKEIKIFCLMIQGLQIKEIGKKLQIKESALAAHLKILFSKANKYGIQSSLENYNQLKALAIEYQLCN